MPRAPEGNLVTALTVMLKGRSLGSKSSRTALTLLAMSVGLRLWKGWGSPNLALMVTWPILN